jgi:hypothetical protein
MARFQIADRVVFRLITRQLVARDATVICGDWSTNYESFTTRTIHEQIMKTISNSLPVWILLVAFLVTPGCRKETVATLPGPKPLETLTEVQVKQKELAFATRDKLFGSLVAELMTSMAENGPAKSISVCKTRARKLLRRSAKKRGCGLDGLRSSYETMPISRRTGHSRW